MCPDCIAAERQRSVEAKLKAEQIHREKISEIWDPNNRYAHPLEEYSLMDVVSMLSMVRGGAAEDYSYIKPVDSFDEHLTPNTEFTVDILRLYPETSYRYLGYWPSKVSQAQRDLS